MAADARGLIDPATFDRVVLTEGQDADAWVAGFAAAAHAGLHDAPVLLSNGAGLPGPTADLLDAIATEGTEVSLIWDPVGPPGRLRRRGDAGR